MPEEFDWYEFSNCSLVVDDIMMVTKHWLVNHWFSTVHLVDQK